ncbi:MAG: chromate transporter [Clostridia bacterium]|nr:chromate transporter [Clostridia bacterium]
MKIGAFTFGGGYAMIPLIQREIVEKRGWITDDDILEIIAVAESTPGPIAINAATFVGWRTAGFAGAFLSTLGVVLPSFLVIVAISFILKEFAAFRAVKYAFFGIRAGMLALLVKALVSMYKKTRKGALSYALMGLAFVLTAVLNVNAIIVIAGCAAAGLAFSYAAGRKVK